MNKDEVIQAMVEIAEEFNVQAMNQASLPEDQVKQMVEQVRPQLYAIQGEIYNFLFDKGVIKQDA
jgi:type III secretion system FlhB-like substrate exporter